MISYPFAVGKTMTRVIEAGAAEAPAVVLVHGLSSRADRWIRNIDALAASGLRVVAVDLPGHGFSIKDAEFDHSVPGYARFLIDFLEAMNIERTALVGTSVGGHVAAYATLLEPIRVSALMLIGSTGLAETPSARADSFWDWMANLTPESHRVKLENVFSDKSLVTDNLVQEDVRINTSPGARECFKKFSAYMSESINDHLVLSRLSELGPKIPLLLYWGSDDASVPLAVGYDAHQKIRGSLLAVVKNLNHTPYYEDPELFNEVLSGFLSGRLSHIRAPGLTMY